MLSSSISLLGSKLPANPILNSIKVNHDRYNTQKEQEAHGALRCSHDYAFNVIVTNLNPLSTPPDADKACYEDDKYLIGFILT